jgi:hypothetical protein
VPSSSVTSCALKDRSQNDEICGQLPNVIADGLIPFASLYAEQLREGYLAQHHSVSKGIDQPPVDGLFPITEQPLGEDRPFLPKLGYAGRLRTIKAAAMAISSSACALQLEEGLKK